MQFKPGQRCAWRIKKATAETAAFLLCESNCPVTLVYWTQVAINPVAGEATNRRALPRSASGNSFKPV